MMGEIDGYRGSAFSAGTAVWIALITASSILFSWALACGTPFAALAAIAAARMRWREGLLLVVFAWVVNQAVGFGVLGYPRTWQSFGWGGAIGVAAVVAFAAALAVDRRVTAGPAALAIGFALAFAAYETVLYGATAVLPSGGDAFSAAVMSRILTTNIVALVGLVVLHRLAVLSGLLSRTKEPGAAGYA